MNIRIDWQKSAAVLVTCLVGGGLILLALRYLFPVLLPFLLAFAISLFVRPAARAIAKRTKLPERGIAAVLLAAFLVLLALLLSWAVGRVFRELGDLLAGLLRDRDRLEEWISSVADTFEGIFALFHREGDGNLREEFDRAASDFLSGLISGMSARLPAFAARLAGAMPDFLFSAAVTVIAGFYFCMDREGVGTTLARVLPERVRKLLPTLKERTKRVSWKYFRAYLLLMLLTFGELFLGFTLLRIRYAFLLALFVALVDLLPVLGVGTVLLPWAAVLLIGRRFYPGFGLLILYGAVMLLRQFAEPKLVGRSLGLHPLLALLASYAGWKLFGVAGLLLAPVFALLAKSLFRQTGTREEHR